MCVYMGQLARNKRSAVGSTPPLYQALVSTSCPDPGAQVKLLLLPLTKKLNTENMAGSAQVIAVDPDMVNQFK